jgi:hypothetical protein
MYWHRRDYKSLVLACGGGAFWARTAQCYVFSTEEYVRRTAVQNAS